MLLLYSGRAVEAFAFSPPHPEVPQGHYSVCHFAKKKKSVQSEVKFCRHILCNCDTILNMTLFIFAVVMFIAHFNSTLDPYVFKGFFFLKNVLIVLKFYKIGSQLCDHRKRRLPPRVKTTSDDLTESTSI